MVDQEYQEYQEKEKSISSMQDGILFVLGKTSLPISGIELKEKAAAAIGASALVKRLFPEAVSRLEKKGKIQYRNGYNCRGYSLMNK